MELRKYKLGEIAEIIPGYAFKSSDFGHGKNIAIKIKDIVPPGIDIKNADTVDVHPGERYQLQSGDYVMAMTGATIGKIGKIGNCEKRIFINQRVCKFIANNLCDKEYLYYVLNSDYFQKFVLNNIDSKLAQPNIGHPTLYKFENLYPTLLEQKRIASVLSNIDSKIELNRAINQNLEAMAKQLYDYWFVQFDFPNEEGKPYKSNGGEMVWNEVLKREIPKDWEVLSFGDLFNIGNGKNIPNSSGTIPAYGGNGIIKYVDKSNYDSCFIVGRVGANCGSLHYSPTKCWVSDNAISVVPKNLNEIAYLLFSLKLYDLSKNKGGSSQPLVTHKGLECLAFPYSVKFVSKFCNIANKLLNLYFENINSLLSLTKQRNELLPLLMNGQVSVNSDLSAH